MKLSDEILQHLVIRHLVPAWQVHQKRLTLRVGDVHKELGYRQRMPAVCSVLGSDWLQRMTGIRLIERQGPQNGSSAQFTFELG